MNYKYIIISILIIILIKMNPAGAAPYINPFHGGVGLNRNYVVGLRGATGAIGRVGASYNMVSEEKIIRTKNNGTRRVYK